MTRIGLPVPPGFTITTEVCTYYYANKKTYPKVLTEQVNTALAKLEAVTGKKFGDRQNPLLVSVRSGARESMPGMMDTILNLGLNDETVEVLAKKSGNARWAWDCYRRFVQMYGDVVMGVQKLGKDDHEPFDEVMDHLKEEARVKEDTELSSKELRLLVDRFKDLIQKRTGKEFPQDPVK
jgi:pyruvate,orthophosphate dikinase